MSSTLAAAPGGLRSAEPMRTENVFELRESARRFADRLGEFTSWLIETVSDAAAVRDIAQRSYWHPNGFAKLVLSSAPDVKLRLHVWPAGEARLGESNPHSHRWQFASTVVVGSGLHMVEYAETGAGGRPYERYRYGGDPGDPAALLADGPTRLVRVAAPHVHRGQIYSCDTDIVHTVAPISDDLTATLVVQGPQRTPTTVVYRSPGLGDDQPNGVVTESDVRALVGAVVDAA